MKVLFIAPLPPPVHGSAMVSQYIKDSKLVNEQFDCDFVNLSTSRRMDEIGKGGAKKLLRFVGAYLAVFWKLLTRRYDLCYLAITCHGMGFLKDAPFVLLCKLFRRKVLIHQHNKGMSRYVDRWPYRWMLPLVYRNARVMLLSWYLYPDISRVVKREQVVVCANGIPPLNVERLTFNVERGTMNNGRGMENEDIVCNSLNVNRSSLIVKILFLSNLIPSKGVYVLLDACRVLKERGLAFVCDFVGGETKEIDRATFEAAVRERGLEGVVCYHGPKYGEEKEAYWQSADVFVFPTFYFNECFPLVLLEAMQHRLPVVSSDEGGIPDIIQHGVNGYAVACKEAAPLAEALEQLITDPALRHQMGERGYQRYREEFTLEAFEKRFAMLIQQSCD